MFEMLRMHRLIKKKEEQGEADFSFSVNLNDLLGNRRSDYEI